MSNLASALLVPVALSCVLVITDAFCGAYRSHLSPRELSCRDRSWNDYTSNNHIHLPRRQPALIPLMASLSSDQRRAMVSESTMSWIKSAVIGLNLCPWAKSALKEGLIDIKVSDAPDANSLMNEVVGNVEEMADSEGRETRIIVTECLLANFADYNKIANTIDKSERITSLSCGELNWHERD
eukprot:753064-Hanusia_phi.AAC.5